MWGDFVAWGRRVARRRAGSAPVRYRPVFDALEDRALPSLAVPTPVGPSGPIMNTTPTLSWNSVTGAQFYVLQIKDANGATQSIHVAEGTSFTPDHALALGHTFQWSVEADSSVAGSNSGFSAPLSFTEINPFAGTYTGTFQGSVRINGSPTITPVNATALAFTLDDKGKLTVTAPGTGAGSVDFTGTIDYAASATASFGKGNFKFEGQVTVSGGVATASGTWTVTFKGGSGSGTWSATAPANKLVGAPLDSVVALHPAGTVAATAPVYSWSPVAHADYYAVQVVDVTDGGATVLTNDHVTATSLVSPSILSLGDHYRWTVTAFSNSGVTSGATVTDFAIGTPFAGAYSGTFTGTAVGKVNGQSVSDPLTGTVTVTVGANGSITVTAPGAGKGDLDLAGAAAFTASGTTGLGRASFDYTGNFDVSGGVASASGTWTAVVGSLKASGTWTAAPTQLSGTPLNTPTTVAPLASTTSVNPVLRWNAVANADFYVVRMTDDKTHKTVLVDTHVTGTSLTPENPLTVGDSYTWSVQAETNADGASACSTPATFTVILAAPEGTSPNGPVQTLKPTFTWGAVDHAASYDLEVKDMTAGGKVVSAKSAINGTSFTLTSPLLINHNYEWLVRARAGNGTLSVFSAAVPFSVAPLTTPSLTPTSSFIENATPSLSWTGVTNADKYVVTVEDVTGDTPKVVASIQVDGTTFTPSAALTTGHAYRWQVQALSTDGDASANSNPLNFTLVSPFAGTYSGSFSGSTSLGLPFGSNFTLTVSNTDLISLVNGLSGNGKVSLLGDFTISGTETVDGIPVTFTLTGTGKIANGVATASGTFQGTAEGQSASGTWTVTATQLTGTPLNTPVLSGPSGPNTSTTPTFSWSPVTGATGYGIAVLDLSAHSATVFVDHAVTGTSVILPAPLKAGHEYQWVLVAFDAAGDASAQVSDTFTVA